MIFLPFGSMTRILSGMLPHSKEWGIFGQEAPEFQVPSGERISLDKA
jgi:hypothetical protein